jgi:nitroreductase
MNFFELAKSRYSVRSFANKHLPKEVLDVIICAGHVAPTGCNYQPQRILVINSDEGIEKLKKCTKCHFNAPTALLVCYNKEECWTRKYDGATSGVIDASIVTTHMMLQAHEIGVGSCWVMHFDPFAMRSEFNIPENIEPVALLVMGYPSPDAEPMALHNQFRPIEEVIIRDSF